jgi:hypothetical protein
MINMTVFSRDFFWGSHKEYQIKEEDLISVSNKNTGLPSSSFFLPTGEFEILITHTNQYMSNYETVFSFQGKLALSGSERDNLWLEENSSNHIRYYGLSNNELNLHVSKELILNNNLDIDKEIFAYVITK